LPIEPTPAEHPPGGEGEGKQKGGDDEDVAHGGRRRRRDWEEGKPGVGRKGKEKGRTPLGRVRP
jgi:hypothetical protein